MRKSPDAGCAAKIQEGTNWCPEPDSNRHNAFASRDFKFSTYRHQQVTTDTKTLYQWGSPLWYSALVRPGAEEFGYSISYSRLRQKRRNRHQQNAFGESSRTDIEKSFGNSLTDNPFCFTLSKMEGGLASPAPSFLTRFFSIVTEAYRGLSSTFHRDFFDHHQVTSTVAGSSQLNSIKKLTVPFMPVGICVAHLSRNRPHSWVAHLNAPPCFVALFVCSCGLVKATISTPSSFRLIVKRTSPEHREHSRQTALKNEIATGFDIPCTAVSSCRCDCFYEV